jgi:hypothetical protein
MPSLRRYPLRYYFYFAALVLFVPPAILILIDLFLKDESALIEEIGRYARDCLTPLPSEDREITRLKCAVASNAIVLLESERSRRCMAFGLICRKHPEPEQQLPPDPTLAELKRRIGAALAESSRGKNMSWKARVYVQKAPNAPGLLHDLGVIDLDGDALVGARVFFLFDGKTESSMIENISNATAPPTIRVSLPRR